MNKELQSTGLSYVCSDAATFHNPWYFLGMICEKNFLAYMYALFLCKAIFSSPTYTPISMSCYFLAHRKDLYEFRGSFYFTYLQFITMSCFGTILISLPSPRCRHFVFLLDVSALYKKQQEWAQVILVVHYFTFSLSETASLERKRNRTVSNSSLFFFGLCIDSIEFCQLSIEKHMALWVL